MDDISDRRHPKLSRHFIKLMRYQYLLSWQQEFVSNLVNLSSWERYYSRTCPSSKICPHQMWTVSTIGGVASLKNGHENSPNTSQFSEIINWYIKSLHGHLSSCLGIANVKVHIYIVK